MAEKWEISEDKKTYTVYLKERLVWHDGTPLTAQDVVFTFKLIQDPAFKSPLRQNWQNVSIEQKDDKVVVFQLGVPYFGFLDTLTTGILPKHAWENTTPDQFPLSSLNLEPIGSGPYRFIKMQKDSQGNVLESELEAFLNYHDGAPYISKWSFQFYSSEESLINAYKQKEVSGIGSISIENFGLLNQDDKRTELHTFRIPHYILVFFNQTKSIPLSYDEVRKALAISLDRGKVVEGVLKGKGTPVGMSFLPGMNGYEDKPWSQFPQQQEAKKILEEAGWKVGDDGIRNKNNTRLEFDIMTPDWSEFTLTADELAKQWRELGAQVNVKVLGVSDLTQNFIRTREYAALLFAQATPFDPDLYAYWHSSQRRDPGLNLSMFQDKDADVILENIRSESDPNKRAELYKNFQEIVFRKNPAVYVFSPHYLYPVDKKVRGIALENVPVFSGRFTHVKNWYIKTKRVLKENGL